MNVIICLDSVMTVLQFFWLLVKDLTLWFQHWMQNPKAYNSSSQSHAGTIVGSYSTNK
jgi:hypothetical protein